MLFKIFQSFQFSLCRKLDALWVWRRSSKPRFLFATRYIEHSNDLIIIDNDNTHRSIDFKRYFQLYFTEMKEKSF